jgi:hypothetical protein
MLVDMYKGSQFVNECEVQMVLANKWDKVGDN